MHQLRARLLALLLPAALAVGCKPTHVASVGITPLSPVVVIGSSVQLSARALDAGGSALEGRAFSWSSSDASIATVSSTGLVQGVAVGVATISASSEGKAGAAQLTVTPTPIASVAIGAPPTLIVGTTAQLSVTLRDASGRVLADRAVSWSSGQPALLAVSSTGLAQGLAVGGPVTVTATSEGKSGTAQIAVIPVPVASVSVEPGAISLIVGATAPLSATTRDALGHILTGRTVAWSSGQPGIVSVSASGLAQALAVGGPVTVTATSEGKSATAQITALAKVASVGITPPASAVFLGKPEQLTATPLDAGGHPLTGRTVAWSSGAPSLATVSSTGLVTAVAEGGPVALTATSEGKTGTAQVTVIDPILTSISGIESFLDHCPTLDPAFAALQQRFQVLLDGQPTGSPACTEPVSAMTSAQITTVLVAWQVLRAAQYMSQGTQGRLPWTQLSLVDWMSSRVAGVNISTTATFSSCCSTINGKSYFTETTQNIGDLGRFKTWPPGIAPALSLYAHEIRHADPGSPGHTNGCPAFPLPTDPGGCDATYDLSNLGSYGVQYWLESQWGIGRLNVGIGCSAPATAQEYAGDNVSQANGERSRFVTNPPPVVTLLPPYGGPCFAQ